jgi:hypothetical protein
MPDLSLKVYEFMSGVSNPNASEKSCNFFSKRHANLINWKQTLLKERVSQERFDPMSPSSLLSSFQSQNKQLIMERSN